MLISKVLQLEESYRNAVQKHQYVRPTVLAFDDRELVDRKPFVVFGVLKIN